MIIAIAFLIVHENFLKSVGIEYSDHYGQLYEDGTYNFGDYSRQVNHLINSKSFVDNGQVLNRYAPGYPLFLYSSVIVSKYLHLDLYYCLVFMAALCIAISSVLIGDIAYLLYKSDILAIIAGLLFTTHPYVLQGLTKVMSETPFMTFLYLSLLVYFIFLIKKPANFIYPALTGFLLGIAMLIRPIGLFLPIVIAICTLFYLKNTGWTKRLLISSVVIISSIVAILPWQIYNYKHGERILLSSDEVGSITDGVSFNNHPGKELLKLPADVDSLSMRLSTSGARTRPDFFKLAYQEFTEQPATMLKLISIKAARSWYGVFRQDTKKERVKLIILGIYASLTLLGLTRIRFDQAAKIIGITSLILVLYFWGMTILVVSMVRYMYPIFGLIVIFIPALMMKKR
jgi:hypothetical protein